VLFFIKYHEAEVALTFVTRGTNTHDNKTLLQTLLTADNSCDNYTR